MIAIGDNLITVARSKRYTAKQFRDLFLYAIGDTETPPDGLEMVAEMIAADQTSIKDRAEAKAAKNRERVRKAREKAKEESAENKGKAASCNACNAGNACNAPYQPTNLPSNADKSACNLDFLVNAASTLGIPHEFAKKFASIMDMQDWAYVNPSGKTVPVGLGNVKTVMGSFWRHENEQAKTKRQGANARYVGTFAQQESNKIGLEDE